jgi:antitoxin MazE
MVGRVQKWGNSQAVRLPKAILEEIGLKENDEVEIKAEHGRVTILPIRRPKTLQERIAEYQGEYICTEWDAGTPKGDEVL